MKIVILNLVAFGQTGGVEKVSRILAKAGTDIAHELGKSVINLSLYDDLPDTRYCSADSYIGFKKNKIRFVSQVIRHGQNAEHMIIAHIHLALPALLAKFINPSLKIHLIGHGIEIWNPLTSIQKALLQKCHQILAVSIYTKKRIADNYPFTAGKIKILNNCLDPFYIAAKTFAKPEHLKMRYGIKPDEKVLITLCRLASSEKYKGYDNVIQAIKELKPLYKFKYLLLGKYDYKEYKRILEVIEKENLEDNVIIGGFIAESELPEHFLLADLFIMPSIKEGFGIAFIEAAAAGLPLIAGNKDGSADAVLNGELGILVEPTDFDSIRKAIIKTLDNKTDPQKQQALAIKHFSYSSYKHKLAACLLS